jgi:hypothetical protein
MFYSSQKWVVLTFLKTSWNESKTTSSVKINVIDDVPNIMHYNVFITKKLTKFSKNYVACAIFYRWKILYVMLLLYREFNVTN